MLILRNILSANGRNWNTCDIFHLIFPCCGRSRCVIWGFYKNIFLRPKNLRKENIHLTYTRMVNKTQKKNVWKKSSSIIKLWVFKLCAFEAGGEKFSTNIDEQMCADLCEKVCTKRTSSLYALIISRSSNEQEEEIN